MWIVVLVAIALVVLFWKFILVGLVLWAGVSVVRALLTMTSAGPTPDRRRASRPVQSRPVSRSVQVRPAPQPVRARPAPARDIPAADYLPRWTPGRRLDAGREHAQWQKEFDLAAYFSDTPTGRKSTKG
ncbi:hypothetical protein [Pseudarthrobacter sp. 1C304]|uniref:hypothetical protein n=1 Tax=Pseudarthrobacter sp. 1C304 TaxID=3457438 RepID=UPI003FD53887